MVGVLVLIHQYIAELPLIICADVLILLQQLHGQQDDIIKVHRVVFFQSVLVLLIKPGDGQHLQIPGVLCPSQKILWHDHFILLTADHRQDILGREGLVVKSHILDQILHDPLRVGSIVDGKAAAVTQAFDIPAQDAATGAVEGHGPDVHSFRSQHIGKPFLQLVSSLICKSDGNDAPGRCRLTGAKPVRPVPVELGRLRTQLLQEENILLVDCIRDLKGIAATAESDQIGDPVDQHSGLTAAGTGQKQQRPFCSQNGLALHCIQIHKLPFDILPPGIQKSGLKLFGHRCTCIFL